MARPSNTSSDMTSHPIEEAHEAGRAGVERNGDCDDEQISHETQSFQIDPALRRQASLWSKRCSSLRR